MLILYYTVYDLGEEKLILYESKISEAWLISLQQQPVLSCYTFNKKGT
jgi:hypothetical protein